MLSKWASERKIGHQVAIAVSGSKRKIPQKDRVTTPTKGTRPDTAGEDNWQRHKTEKNQITKATSR